MSERKQSFLTILRQKHPFLYKVCCCILFIYFGLNIFLIEIPPVFLFAMYSVPIENRDTQELYDFVYNDNKTWKMHEMHQHHKRITFYYTIDFYTKSINEEPIQATDGVKLKKRLEAYPSLYRYAEKVYATAEEIRSYPKWLHAYMQDIVQEPIDSYWVLKRTVHYHGSELQALSIDTIISYTPHYEE